MGSQTRLLLSCAAVGVAGGLVNIGNAYLFATMSVAVPWLLGLGAGFSWLPGIVALALFRRGGVALLTLLIAGVAQAPFVPTGVTSISAYLIIGVLLEVPFAAFRYRLWSVWLFYAAAVFGATVYGSMWLIFYAASGLPLWQLVLIPIVLTISVLAFTWLGRFLAERVARTGVLRGIRTPAERAPHRPR